MDKINGDEIENWLNESTIDSASTISVGDNEVQVFSLFDENVTSKVIIKELRRVKHIGLTLISRKRSQPLLICLTAKNKIFTFDVHELPQVEFVERLLRDKNLKFYTVDGLYDADMFKRFFNIDLSDNRSYNMTDLQCLDIYLAVRKEYLTTPLENQYTLSFLYEHVIPGRVSQNNYETLVCKWLEGRVSDDEKLICTDEELDAIERDYTSDLAFDAIKKRAAYISDMAVAMLSYYKRKRDTPTRALLSFARRATNREDFDRLETSSYSSLCSFLSQCPEVDQKKTNQNK